MHPAGEVAPAVGDDRIARQLVAQVRDDLGQMQHSRVGHRQTIFEVLAVRGFGLSRPGRGIDRPKRSGRGRELWHASVDWQFRLVHASELFNSHVNVHERLFGARNVEEGVTGANDLAQARSDGEDEIGVTHALRELRTRPDGEVARIARVEVIDAVLAAKRAGGREPVGLGKRDDVANRLRRPRAASEQHQRPTGSGEQLAQPRHLGRTRACLHRFVGCGVNRRRSLAQHVFGEHHHHWAGAAEVASVNARAVNSGMRAGPSICTTHLAIWPYIRPKSTPGTPRAQERAARPAR